jgi:hypothetical protein
MNGRDRRSALTVSLLLLSIAACGAPSGEDLGATAEPVLNGTPVPADNLGSVMLWECDWGAASCCGGSAASCSTSSYGFHGGCSGTMVADRWMLTAGHCATGTDNTSGGGVPLLPFQLVALSGDRASMSSADQVFLHPTLDVALVHLASSITNAGGHVLHTPLYTGTSVSLMGKKVYCQGYGVSDAARSTYGTLRSALLDVNGASSGWVALAQNASGQLLAPGDSGTGCFLFGPTETLLWPLRFNALVAVDSVGFPGGTTGVGADGFASWASGVVSANACRMQSAQCGSITDALGDSVNCGQCYTGPCVRNACTRFVPPGTL